MKSNSVMSYEVVDGKLTWTFSDGKKSVFDPSKAATLTEQAAIHGFKQKIADAAAMSVNTDTGKPATVAEKRAAMEKVIANLYNGQWSGPREGGGGSGILAAAFLVVFPKQTKEKVAEFLKGLTPTERLALAKTPKVAAAIAKIETERTKDVDTDALFKDFDAIK